MIKDVQTAVIESNYDWTLVKIIADEGVGYGECFFALGLPDVIRQLSPLLIKQDPTNITKLLRSLKTAGLLTSPHGGALQHALAGIETALWDLLGKSLGAPLYRLWGGAYRNEIRLYADCHGGEGLASLSSILAPRTPWWLGEEADDPPHEVHPKYHGGRAAEAFELNFDLYARRAREAAEQGYTILKFDLDIPNPHSRDDYNRTLEPQEIDLLIEVVRAVRDSIPEEVGLAVDCHWSLSATSGAALGRALEPFKLLWIEDPVPPESDEALARVVRESPTPVASGENHYSAVQFNRLLQLGMQIAAPDLQKTGFAEGRRIAELAELFTVPLAPHNISSPIGTLAAAHLAATIPNFLVLEHHGIDVPFWEELASEREGPVIQKGHVVLDGAPGLGITLDEEVAYRHRKRDEAFFGEAS
ncbi:MAG: mandelate racemase/muconate lactonizing enzyme family protein [Actinobacteria bacterium]|nr:mandelate racemase/muconate lactonizing enzyme family protein [Actinomycetota bacterium]MDQ3531447.1 mandelate racemase/muconate lactonizing enzyme family protein [Actinomycetota bacterium]